MGNLLNEEEAGITYPQRVDLYAAQVGSRREDFLQLQSLFQHRNNHVEPTLLANL